MSMSKRPSTAPSFGWSGSCGPQREPRAVHAGLWAAFCFNLGMLSVILQGPEPMPSRLGIWVPLVAWSAGSMVCGWLAAVSAQEEPNARRTMWRTALRVSWLPLLLTVMLLLQFHGWGARDSGVPTPELTDTFLAQQVAADSIKDWDEDVAAWAIAVEEFPEPEREAALADFRAALLPLLEQSYFIPHGSLAAAADAGVFRGEGARALLTAPRRHSADPPQDPEEAARRWLASFPPHQLADPMEYAFAVAVHDLLPGSTELRAQVAAELAREDGVPIGDDELKALARLVRLADLVGVDTEVPAFRERVVTALRVLHRDELWDSWAWPIGFVSDAKGPGSSQVDPLATHAALQLMDRFGVPEFVNLSRQRAACAYRSRTHWYDFTDKVVSAQSVAFLQRRWPQESAPAFTWLDLQTPLALALLCVAAFSIRRKPLIDPSVPAPRVRIPPTGPMKAVTVGDVLEAVRAEAIAARSKAAPGPQDDNHSRRE